MGGNALNFKTRRVSREEFQEIEDEVIFYLNSLYPNTEIFSLYDGGIAAKQDFGDLDILLCKSCLDKYSFADIKKAFNSRDYSLNSGTWSFDYKDFQVDLIFVEPRYFDSSVLYFLNGDAGNLLGRLFHKFGLKFGHKGLVYIVRTSGGHPFAEITLTQDIKDVCSFIGVDYVKYLSGFKDLEDLFQFVANSPYFNPDIYLLDNQNHQNRTRDRKRVTYNAFLTWCKNQENLNHFQFSEDKSAWFEKIESRFPGFVDKLTEFQHQIAAVERFKVKYNGEIVSALTGLQGQNLGKFMAFIKESENGKEEFVQKVLDKNEEEIKMLVLTYFKSWNH